MVYVVDDGQVGRWRAALNPDAWCRGCRQSVCGCPDVIYQGLLDPVEGGGETDRPAFTPVLSPFHAAEIRRGQ